MIEALILVTGGFLIGIFGVIFGGSMFFSIPLIQLIFPEALFGVVIGNIKTGSFFRGLGSTLATIKYINWKKSLLLAAPLVFGTILGVMIISRLDQSWILPAIIFAVVLAEIAPSISKWMSKKTYAISSLFIGAYTGILGAGVGIFLIALLRTQNTDDSKIAQIKIQARFIEFTLVIIAVITHLINNDLVAKIWVPWAVGSIVGGLAGGQILKKIGSMPGSLQKGILRISFVFAIAIALINTFK